LVQVGSGSEFPSYLYPIRDVIEIDSNSVEHEKRSEEYDRHTNEVIKQASMMTSAVVRLVSSVHSVIVTVCLTFLIVDNMWT
jgi:hypothetical protein